MFAGPGKRRGSTGWAARRRDQGGEDPPCEGSGRDHRAGGEAQNKNKGGIPNPHPNTNPVQFRFKTKQNEEQWKATVFVILGALSSLGGPVGPSARAAKSERRKGARAEKEKKN